MLTGSSLLPFQGQRCLRYEEVGWWQEIERWSETAEDQLGARSYPEQIGVIRRKSTVLALSDESTPAG